MVVWPEGATQTRARTFQRKRQCNSLRSDWRRRWRLRAQQHSRWAAVVAPAPVAVAAAVVVVVRPTPAAHQPLQLPLASGTGFARTVIARWFADKRRGHAMRRAHSRRALTAIAVRSGGLERPEYRGLADFVLPRQLGHCLAVGVPIGNLALLASIEGAGPAELLALGAGLGDAGLAPGLDQAA